MRSGNVSLAPRPEILYNAGKGGGKFIMLVTYNRKKGTPLTPEQIAEIEEAAKYPIVFDEDCPEMTEEQLRQFRRVNPRQDDAGLLRKFG